MMNNLNTRMLFITISHPTFETDAPIFNPLIYLYILPLNSICVVCWLIVRYALTEIGHIFHVICLLFLLFVYGVWSLPFFLVLPIHSFCLHIWFLYLSSGMSMENNILIAIHSVFIFGFCNSLLVVDGEKYLNCQSGHFQGAFSRGIRKMMRNTKKIMRNHQNLLKFRK